MKFMVIIPDAKEIYEPAKQTLNNRATEKRNGLKKIC